MQYGYSSNRLNFGVLIDQKKIGVELGIYWIAFSVKKEHLTRH